jgi:ribonuclease D
LTRARTGLGERATELNLPVENLLTPDFVRRVMWQPPEGEPDGDLVPAVGAMLASLGARAWQIELTAAILADAITSPEPPPETPKAPEAPEAPEAREAPEAPEAPEES